MSDYPLIGTGDPPPLEVLNVDGNASVLLVGDHAGNAVPRAMNRLGLDPEVMTRHVAYDIGTRKLVTHLSQHLDAPAAVAGYSRLVVDLNRSLEDPSAFPEVSDDIRIPDNQGLSREQRALRIESFYTPYRMTIDRLLYSLRERGTVPALIAIHRFTPDMAGQKRPWHVGMLWDKDPRIPVPSMAALRAHPDGFNVGGNQPYSGRHPADYTIDHHAEAAGLPHVSIEIRQDLIDSEQGAERWASILHDALRDILAAPELYRIWEN